MLQEEKLLLSFRRNEFSNSRKENEYLIL